VNDPLATLAEIFSTAGVSYAVIGGHGVNAWLEPRATGDVDVTMEAGLAAHARIEEALLAAGFRATRMHGVDLASGPDFVRYESDDGIVRLEIQAAKTALQAELLRRARRAENGLRVATPEDLLVLKLIANPPKDRIDVLGLAALPSLDWGYVERAAADWGVVDRLRSLRDG
jgi:hypothetical protein